MHARKLTAPPVRIVQQWRCAHARDLHPAALPATVAKKHRIAKAAFTAKPCGHRLESSRRVLVSGGRHRPVGVPILYCRLLWPLDGYGEFSGLEQEHLPLQRVR